jgi:hypothetical protein
MLTPWQKKGILVDPLVASELVAWRHSQLHAYVSFQIYFLAENTVTDTKLLCWCSPETVDVLNTPVV